MFDKTTATPDNSMITGMVFVAVASPSRTKETFRILNL
jgi:hypothetical protein